MKPNINFALSALCILVSVVSCNDNLSSIGSTTCPQGDGMTVKHTTFDIPVSTAYRDSIYVRTGYPLLGVIVDPNFGEIDASYLAQFYVNSEFSLNAYNASDSMVFNILKTSVPASLGYDWDDYHYRSWDSLCGNRLDSMTIRIFYETSYGDSLVPMMASVYSLHPDVDFESLPESEFYSNNDFSAYYSEDNLLGRKAYTAANRELSDSIRELNGYMNYIEVKLTDDLKEKFYRAAVEAAVARDKNNPHHGEYRDVFADMNTFREELLSGVCVRPTFGDGNMIKVYYTAIYFFYSSFHKYDVDGTLLRNEDDTADSTYVTSHVKYIAVTPDVIQMSGYQFEDDRRADRLASADTAFVTSPQGYYTVVDLPVGKIINTMVHDPLHNAADSSYFLNGANFYLQGYKPEGSLLNNTPPPYLLMVEQTEMEKFFERRELPDSETSCYASYVADSVSTQMYYYNFGNINSVIIGLAEKHGWSKDKNPALADDFTIPMAIIPVELTTNSNYGTILSTSTYILPTAFKIKRGEGQQTLQMIYSVEQSQ